MFFRLNDLGRSLMLVNTSIKYVDYYLKSYDGDEPVNLDISDYVPAVNEEQRLTDKKSKN